MRKTFIQTVSQLASNNNKIQVLLGDISVFAFKKNNQLPPNIYNMGILEQSMVAFGAGLSAEGYFPIIHTISPFIIERAFEQIKVNFCLNDLPGILITVGGVCDYYSLGRTHHCPNDMSIISTLPNIEFACPKNEESLIKIIKDAVSKKRLIYIRLTENFLNLELNKKNSINRKPVCHLYCGEYIRDKLENKNVDRIYIDSSLELKKYKWNYKEIHVFEPSIGASFSNRLRKFFNGKIISNHLNLDGTKLAKNSFVKTRRAYEYKN